MAGVLAVAGGKGGVGTTTVAVNLGVALQEAGTDTVLVDADLAMGNVAHVLDLEHEPTLHDVLAGEATLDDALTKGPSGLAVVPGSPALTDFAEADPTVLPQVVSTLQEGYDVVLLDTSGGLSQELTVALQAADETVLVTTPEHGAVSNTDTLSDLVPQTGTDVAGVVVTQVRDDEPTAVAEQLAQELLVAVPHYRSAVTEPVVSTGADGDATSAYEYLAAAVTGDAPGMGTVLSTGAGSRLFGENGAADAEVEAPDTPEADGDADVTEQEADGEDVKLDGLAGWLARR